ncbi:MAG: ATPase, partial [Proteobacteria bacterium]|nr:ATPase [Pseudomonadota bacterium]
MKRFYKQAAATLVSDGFGVQLDGRQIKTPAKHPLVLPNEALANAIVDEWMAQGDEIIPQSMPLTGLSNAAIDLGADHRDGLVQAVAEYAGTDLLCYRAESPAALRSHQDEKWQPLLDWASGRLEASFVVTAGILHVRQDDRALDAARDYGAKHDGFGIVGLNKLTHAMGSFVLAMAVCETHIPVDEAFDLSVLDEL